MQLDSNTSPPDAPDVAADPDQPPGGGSLLNRRRWTQADGGWVQRISRRVRSPFLWIPHGDGWSIYFRPRDPVPPLPPARASPASAPPAHPGPRAAREQPDHPHHTIVEDALERKRTTTMTWEQIAGYLRIPGETPQQKARTLRRWRADYAQLHRPKRPRLGA